MKHDVDMTGAAGQAVNGKASFSKLMTRPHLAATKLLGYALNCRDHWQTAADIWKLRLTERERADHAWAALTACSPDLQLEVANAVIGGAGEPLPPFISPMDEAEGWSRIASPRELEAFAIASFKAMRPERQAAFLAFVGGVAE